MNDITIGLDISKSVFQVHAEDCAGAVVLAKRLRRGQVEAFFAKLPPARIGTDRLWITPVRYPQPQQEPQP